jgi:hypothetical protein
MSARGCQKMGGLASDSTEAEQIVHHLPVKFTPEGIEFFGPLLFFLPAKLPSLRSNAIISLCTASMKLSRGASIGCLVMLRTPSSTLSHITQVMEPG